MTDSLLRLQMQMRAALDPAVFAREVLQFPLDPWQERAIRSQAAQALTCCSRQSGKSTMSAIAALHEAQYNPGSLTLMIAPTQRQSTELLAKAGNFLRKLPDAAPDAESSIAIKFGNGSRIISLPGGDPDRIRGFSAPSLVIVDEAAFVTDALYVAMRPMLAVGKGRLLAMSTPNGRRGWFFEAWEHDPPGEWHKESITARECPRITSEFLERERRQLGDRIWRQEYLCEFISAEDELFSIDDINAAITTDLSALPIRLGI